MANEVLYAVSEEKGNLVRFTGRKAELYCPNMPNVWVEMPHLNEIRTGFGDSIWYDFISEEEAKDWMEKFKNAED